MKKIFTTFLLPTCYLLLTTSSALAQQVGFSISPPVVEAVIKPGKSVTQIFNITNLSASDKIVVAKIVPFTPASNTGFPILKPGLQPKWLSFFSLANSYIKLNEPFTLEGESSAQLILKIAPPANATLNDYYATLILTTNSTPEDSDQVTTGSLISATIGANILLTVNIMANPATIVRIRDFAPAPEDILFRWGDLFFADNLSPIRFRAAAENTGKFMTKTGGLVRVSRNNQAVSLVSLLPLNLLSANSREVQASPSGEIKFKPKFLDLGSHKVELDLRSENSSSHSEFTLVLLPLKTGLSLITGLGLIFLTLTALKYRKNQASKTA